MQKIGIGKTDVGKVRQNNEDSIFVSNNKVGPLPNLFIVADGMGGHNAGEVASAKSIESFVGYLQNCSDNMTIADIILASTEVANKYVYRLSLDNPAHSGMGTTFTSCVINNNYAYYTHVGDSRLYLITDNNIMQITEDHTFVNEIYKSGQLTKEEAENHPKRNMLTRALGTENATQIDIGCISVGEGQKIVICSDGLTNMLFDEDILEIVNSTDDIEKATDKLIGLANINGGYDNVSVIIIHT